MPRLITPAITPALLAIFQTAVQHAHAHAHTHTSHTHVPHWLIHLGMPGLFVVSLLDAAIIPLPLPGSTDLLLLLLCAQRGSQPTFLAVIAVIASVLGGYTTWLAGHKGGEAMLEHFVPKRMRRPITRWMRSHGFATISISGILPPPVPLMPLLLGAGALGASRRHFLTAFSVARSVRYGLVAWVGATYGRRVLHWWNQYLSNWSAVILWTFLGLLVTAMAFGFWQYRRQKRSWEAEKAGRSARETDPPAGADASVRA